MAFSIEGWLPGGRCDPSITPAKEIPDMYVTAKHEVRQVKKFCGECVEITPCYTAALDDPKITGIRGGTTSNERRAIRIYLKDNPGTITPPQPRG